MKAPILLTLASSAMLSACLATDGPVTDRKPYALNRRQVEEIKVAVGRDLRDPLAAQYQNIQARRILHQNGVERVIVCGAVNAKNAYGGYVGYMTFGGEIEDDKFRLIGVDRSKPGYYDANCRLNFGMTVQ